MRKSKRSGRCHGGAVSALFIGAVAVLGTIALVKQLPEIRRYIKAATM